MTGEDNDFLGDLGFAPIREGKEPATKRHTIDQASAHALFEYRDGRLYWKVNSGFRTKRGDRAGSQKQTGYRSVEIYGTAFQEHRIVYLWHTGELPDYVDHINGIKNDNRIENLRESNASLNQANRNASLSTSKYKGVSRHGKSWRSAVQKDGKTEVIGYFMSEAEAASAYNQRAKSLFGDHAKLNDLGEV